MKSCINIRLRFVIMRREGISVRVGEALMKERKSFARWMEGLEEAILLLYHLARTGVDRVKSLVNR